MKTDQGSFFQLDPIHGRGALLAYAENLDLIDEVAWSLSPDGRNVAYLAEHNGNQIMQCWRTIELFYKAQARGKRCDAPARQLVVMSPNQKLG